jgi:DNA-binding transcriptional LysR family regulator
MDITQLKGFLAVAREKSFSKAAKKLFKTQSTVSIQVKALEDEIGVKLFDRINPRKTELSKDGLLFLELASSVINDFDSLIERLNEKRGTIKGGEIKLATHEPVIAYLLPVAIKWFKKKYPDVKITLLRKEREDVLASVSSGEADLGISYLKKVPPSLNYEIIGRHDRVLVTLRNHPLATKNEIKLQDIAEYPLILPPLDSSTRRIIDEVFKTRGLEYKLALEVAGRESIKKYIELGFGISVVNESILSKDDRKIFFIKNVAKFFGQSERAVIMRKHRFWPRYIDEFVRLIKLQQQPFDAKKRKNGSSMRLMMPSEK